MTLTIKAIGAKPHIILAWRIFEGGVAVNG
jgi:hypothetical protein